MKISTAAQQQSRAANYVARPEQAPTINRTVTGFEDLLRSYLQTWQSGSNRWRGLQAKLPDAVRPQIEAQLLLNRLDMQTQLLTRAADTVGSIIRRTQNLAGG